MLSYIGLIGFEFTVIEMNKNNLKRGESLTPFEVVGKAENRMNFKDVRMGRFCCDVGFFSLWSDVKDYVTSYIEFTLKKKKESYSPFIVE